VSCFLDSLYLGEINHRNLKTGKSGGQERMAGTQITGLTRRIFDCAPLAGAAPGRCHGAKQWRQSGKMFHTPVPTKGLPLPRSDSKHIMKGERCGDRCIFYINTGETSSEGEGWCIDIERILVVDKVFGNTSKHIKI